MEPFQRIVNAKVLELVEDITEAVPGLTREARMNILATALRRAAEVVEEQSSEADDVVSNSRFLVPRYSEANDMASILRLMAPEETSRTYRELSRPAEDIENQPLAEGSILALRRFTVFPRLPIELRFLIWECATNLVKPRIVEIERRCRQNQDEDFSPRGEPDDPFISPTPCHPLLRTCHESRKIMLQKWPLSFGDASHEPRIPFNFAIDTLYLRTIPMQERSFGQRVRLEERNMIERVIMELGQYEPDSVLDDMPIDGPNNKVLLRVQMLNEDFPNLNTLYWPTSIPEMAFELECEYLYDRGFCRVQQCPPGRSHNVDYEEYFDVHLDDCYDDILPHFLALGEPGLELCDLEGGDPGGGFHGPEFKDCEGDFPITTVTRLKMEFIDMQVDSWGYPLKANMEQREIRKKVHWRHKFVYGWA